MAIADKLQAVATNMEKVYNAGFAAGKAEGGGDDYESLIWDAIQNKGARDNYNECFNYASWNDENFRPKYSMRPIQSNVMFRNSSITDLVTPFESKGLVLDFSQSGNTNGLFSYSAIERVGVVDISTAHVSYCNPFQYATKLREVEKVIFADKNYQSPFWLRECYALVNIIAEGVIAMSIYLSHSSLLTIESAKSFILCLKNYVGTDKEFACTITFNPATWELLDAEGETASPNGNSWKDYITDIGWLYL